MRCTSTWRDPPRADAARWALRSRCARLHPQSTKAAHTRGSADERKSSTRASDGAHSGAADGSMSDAEHRSTTRTAESEFLSSSIVGIATVAQLTIAARRKTQRADHNARQCRGARWCSKGARRDLGAEASGTRSKLAQGAMGCTPPIRTRVACGTPQPPPLRRSRVITCSPGATRGTSSLCRLSFSNSSAGHAAAAARMG